MFTPSIFNEFKNILHFLGYTQTFEIIRLCLVFSVFFDTYFDKVFDSSSLYARQSFTQQFSP